jgi:hypothetical protein
VAAWSPGKIWGKNENEILQKTRKWGFWQKMNAKKLIFSHILPTEISNETTDQKIWAKFGQKNFTWTL